MIKSPNFWSEEANAPLLTLEHGHLRENQEKILELAQKWKTTLFTDKVKFPQYHKHIGICPFFFILHFVEVTS